MAHRSCTSFRINFSLWFCAFKNWYHMFILSKLFKGVCTECTSLKKWQDQFRRLSNIRACMLIISRRQSNHNVRRNVNFRKKNYLIVLTPWPKLCNLFSRVFFRGKNVYKWIIDVSLKLHVHICALKRKPM
jgi:hypothetical protein